MQNRCPLTRKLAPIKRPSKTRKENPFVQDPQKSKLCDELNTLRLALHKLNCRQNSSHAASNTQR